MRNSISCRVFWILFHFFLWSEMSRCLILAMMIKRVSLVTVVLLFMGLFGYQVQPSSCCLLLIRVARGIIQLKLEGATSQVLLELLLASVICILHRRAELAQCFHYSIINYNAILMS